jgi:hypothetical protein
LAVAAAWAFLLWPLASAAQDPEGQQVVETMRARATDRGPVPQAGSPYMPKDRCADITDAATREVCWKAYQASLGYYQTGLTHRIKVIRWQHTSTVIIFFVVLALVAIGVYFAWLQFARSLRKAGASEALHSVELSMGSIKVSSPVLGVIILTLSLAFFYLYLVYAYPIHEIF